MRWTDNSWNVYELLNLPEVTFEEIEITRNIGQGSGRRAYMAGMSDRKPILIRLGEFGGAKLKSGDVIVNIEACFTGADGIQRRFLFEELTLINQVVHAFDNPDHHAWSCRWETVKSL